jgi:predicted RecA/RadA family phage recombinase
MKNFVSNGTTVDYTATAAVTSGDPVLVGAVLGVAVGDMAIGDAGVLSVEGVFTLPKGAVAITKGAQVYWDDTNSVVTTTATDNTACGKAFAAAASGDATVDIKINV